MDISEHKIGNVTVLNVAGQAVLTSRPERLSEVIGDRLEAGDRLFVINLEDCRRMDSMGLGALVKSYHLVTDRKGVLKLANVPLPLRGVISVAKLTDVMDVFDSERAAINSFGS
ncbi:MAG TPA: STAS domain-containing protein [Blastocatellia bacterium]|nr:STAS domain-containing protein [Blastocatellia bacterium]